MSKMSEQLLHTQELQQEYYWKFMDHIYRNLVSNELSESDINKMESEHISSLPQSKRIIPESPLNNIYYNNPIGA